MAKKYKVMQFIHGLSMGGAETLVKDYTTMLSDDIESVVVIFNERNGYANEIAVLNKGIKIISLKERQGLLGKQHLLRRMWYHFDHGAWKEAYIKELGKVIKEEKPDCIHVHMSLLEYLAPLADELKDTKLLYTCHNLPNIFFGEKNHKEFEAAKKLISVCGLRMIALHNDMKKELNNIFDVSNTLVVRNGINLKRFFQPSTDKKSMRKVLEIPANAFVVGHVGRFAKQKNHKFLVEIFMEIKKKESNAFLLLVGAGENKMDILDLLDSNGMSGNYLCLDNRGDIPEVMTAMDVFVLPSLFEGLGIVAVEAQAVGLKCFISDKVPKDVLLTDHVNSIGLDKTAKEWAEKILTLDVEKENLTGSLQDYDMNEEIKYLAKIYRGEV